MDWPNCQGFALKGNPVPCSPVQLNTTYPPLSLSMEVCCDNDDTKTRKTGEPCSVLPTDKLATHIL